MGREAEEAANDIRRCFPNPSRSSSATHTFLHFSAGSGKRTPLFHSTDEYVNFVCGLIPRTARHVKFFGNGHTSKIKSALRCRLKEGRQLDMFSTDLIHDRYIIKDNTEGRMIGTSFGGFGNKIFTVLPLPREDTAKLLRLLYILQLGGTP